MIFSYWTYLRYLYDFAKKKSFVVIDRLHVNKMPKSRQTYQLFDMFKKPRTSTVKSI